MIQGTAKQLLDFNQEIQLWRSNGSVLSLLMASKINNFYKCNEQRIKSIQHNLNVLFDEYIQHDEQHRPKFEPSLNDKQEPILEANGRPAMKPVMIEGKDYKELEEKHHAILYAPVNINW